MAEKRGRKRKNGLYFGPEQEEAVVRFLNEEDSIIRNKIYNEFLREPLNTMIDSIIRRYKLYRKNYSFEDLHSDTLSYLIIKAEKFDSNKGKRAYSYYGTICKHYILGLMIKDAKYLNQTSDFDMSLGKIHSEAKYSYDLPDTNYQLLDFINNISEEIKIELLEEGIDNKKKMTDNERKVGEALVYILDNWEIIFENLEGGAKYNKNTILATIRSYTGLITKDIRISMRRYKKIYGLIKTSKIDNGYL
jgi:hypothetical protein